MERGTRRGSVLALVLTAALAGCGEQTTASREDAAAPEVPAASPTAMLPADGPVRAVATVLDDGDGPELCLGGVAMSLPPQCSGPSVAGWEWDAHPDHESAGGVRWGEYTMTGAWDGTTFTPTDVRASEPGDVPSEDVGALFASRCAEPEGGWVPVDPATTTDQALSAAHRVAEKLPGYAISWHDQTINPMWEASQRLDGGEGSLEVELAMNDPRYTVLNVGVTDDVAAAEAAVREVWGGPLCVSDFANTEARLREVSEDVADLPGLLTRGYGSISNTVEVGVVLDDGSIQAWADEEYGEGVVTVTSALVPAE
ncbi:hypothetical protein KDN32_14575 [Nocardioides sp. J2M5]|uniref:hypothetical protein n=1 Tax=Nocardioides palaemonis TaxID=2829810 RepID=UPI001BADC67C|nr:hypothetical protein [Nocardioides palaemonis]MBS2938962.1 hypothetical protein [Nocardioides palaemonis]